MRRLRLQYKPPKLAHMPHPLARTGPRPLPLHLGTALMTWASSESAWRLWKNGSPNSKPGFATADGLPELLREISAVDPAQFEAALKREIGRRLERLAEGVLAYRQSTVHRTLDTPPAI